MAEGAVLLITSNRHPSSLTNHGLHEVCPAFSIDLPAHLISVLWPFACSRHSAAERLLPGPLPR